MTQSFPNAETLRAVRIATQATDFHRQMQTLTRGVRVSQDVRRQLEGLTGGVRVSQDLRRQVESITRDFKLSQDVRRQMKGLAGGIRASGPQWRAFAETAGAAAQEYGAEPGADPRPWALAWLLAQPPERRFRILFPPALGPVGVLAYGIAASIADDDVPLEVALVIALVLMLAHVRFGVWIEQKSDEQ